MALASLSSSSTTKPLGVLLSATLLSLLAWKDPLPASMLGLTALAVAATQAGRPGVGVAAVPALLLILGTPALRARVLLPDAATTGPDMGTWWYFMSEVFTQFQPYFRLILAAHPFLYLPPLAVRVLAGATHRPLAPPLLRLLFLVVAAIALLFHPAPRAEQQLGLVLALFGLHPDLLGALRPKLLLLGVGLVVPLVLGPVMRYLWLEARSGNANYLYFQTLVWSSFLMLLVLEVTVVLVQRATFRAKKPKGKGTKQGGGNEATTRRRRRKANT